MLDHVPNTPAPGDNFCGTCGEALRPGSLTFCGDTGELHFSDLETTGPTTIVFPERFRLSRMNTGPLTPPSLLIMSQRGLIKSPFPYPVNKEMGGLKYAELQPTWEVSKRQKKSEVGDCSGSVRFTILIAILILVMLVAAGFVWLMLTTPAW